MKLRINFKAVIVVIFGIFCVYSYFRLVGPYLDVGLPVEKESDNVFTRESVEIDGFNYSYWTNGVSRPRKTVVMLPPSTAMGDYFAPYADIFPEDILIIAPDYPGRGLTDSIEAFDTAPLLAGRVAILLRNLLANRSFDVVGPSFGGMVGTELAHFKDLNINRIFLLATGEFFANDQKIMYKALFYPAKVSEQIRNNYVFLLTGGGRFREFKDSNIQDILEQWLTVIDYKIDTRRKSAVPTVIVVFNRDNVVRPESAHKLEEVFTNSTVVNVDLTHTSDNFFSPEIQNMLTSEI